jgi:hypothetical protein
MEFVCSHALSIEVEKSLEQISVWRSYHATPACFSGRHGVNSLPSPSAKTACSLLQRAQLRDTVLHTSALQCVSRHLQTYENSQCDSWSYLQDEPHHCNGLQSVVNHFQLLFLST